MSVKTVFLVCFSIFGFINTQGQTCTSLLKECIIQNGESLLNSRYEGGPLDKSQIEQLNYCSDKFDCVTFVEYVLALSILQTLKESKNPDFEKILTKIRYKDGLIDGYASRLHYFTAWIIQNKKNGYIEDVSKEIGGIPWQKKIHFLSSNLKKYPRLKSEQDISKIKFIENTITNTTFHYIPKNQVNSTLSKIKNGDIIAITTNINGLDVVHTGIAINKNGIVRLMHASSDEKKVVISKESLARYLMNKPNQTGIMVLRPICKNE